MNKRDTDSAASDKEDKEKEHQGINRREFLAGTSAAVVSAARTNLGEKPKAADIPETFRSPAGSLIPYSRQELLSTGREPRTFTGASLSEVAFPLGGIGTGTVSLGGRGELRDWEIFNRPGKGKVLPFSFAAIWLREAGADPALRVVESRILPPYRGSFGYHRESAEGLPRFANAKFGGQYPFAHIDFEDDSLPISVSLEAFNPFVPLDVDASSIPTAIFKYRVKSRSRKAVDVSLAFSLLNAVGYDGTSTIYDFSAPFLAGFGKNRNTFRQRDLESVKISGLDLTSEKFKADDIRYGSTALLTTHPQVSARTAWESGAWWDAFQQWLNEYGETGEFHGSESQLSQDGRSNYASLAARLQLRPGESREIVFILAWYFPQLQNYWDTGKPTAGMKLRNYYATRFKGAWEVGCYTVERLGELEKKTRDFQRAFFSSALPGYVLEAISSQVSILRTNTCLLLEGKQFFAFEGCEDERGCCPMNCTHVWNYEQALAFLYPELERFMREVDFKYNLHPDGAMMFRTLIPLGHGQWKFQPAADGQMGCIMKLYREWQVSGDDSFLRSLWPQAKQALEFAWVHWDANRDGIMEGEQHNTYDIDFYGPNPMMSILYLSALRAAEIMASHLGDTQAAGTYRSLRESGRQKMEELWNGDFYIQKIPPLDQINPIKFESDEQWYFSSFENGKLRYQFGDGCLSDQLLGQWFAEVVGLGHLVDPDKIQKTLHSIYRYNFRHNFFEYPNPQRIFALNDEKALLLCTWPKGKRPALPFIYSDEAWTGVEYQVAAHLIYEGFTEEGLAIVRAVTDRYDGVRRNPWNEIECGSHYARALASWSVLLALSGYTYSAVEGRLGFGPRLNGGDFRCFFSTGTGWGTFSQRQGPSKLFVELRTAFGNIRLRQLTLRNVPTAGTWSVIASVSSGASLQPELAVSHDGREHQIDFGREIAIEEGASLLVSLTQKTT